MRQAPLHYSQVGVPVPNTTVVHASRQAWNAPSNNYGAPMPPQMASGSYPPPSTQPIAAPPSTLANGLSPIPELSSLPYSHFAHAHSDDTIAVYSGDAYPGVRYTVPPAPRPGLVPVHALSGLIAVKQEADEPLEVGLLSSRNAALDTHFSQFLPPSHHLPASHPDASALSWDQYGHIQENAAVDAYTESPTYSHEYYHVDENPSPEPAWPAEVYYAQQYSQSYSEPHHETYQSSVDSSAHDHAPVLHQPQPMVPAVIPYHH
ncbi:hypothetical protein PENSPDRAFT_199038 [Peniophora sp. CONT]|nr:hypothetical protein PENSPDRAFT_199038 [Peniophora sp. CONT]